MEDTREETGMIAALCKSLLQIQFQTAKTQYAA